MSTFEEAQDVQPMSTFEEAEDAQGFVAGGDEHLRGESVAGEGAENDHVDHKHDRPADGDRAAANGVAENEVAPEQSRQDTARRLAAEAQDLGIHLFVRNGELVREAGWADEGLLLKSASTGPRSLRDFRAIGGGMTLIETLREAARFEVRISVVGSMAITAPRSRRITLSLR